MKYLPVRAEPDADWAPTVSLTVTLDSPDLALYSPTSCLRMFLTMSFLLAPLATVSYFKMLKMSLRAVF